MECASKGVRLHDVKKAFGKIKEKLKGKEATETACRAATSQGHAVGSDVPVGSNSVGKHKFRVGMAVHAKACKACLSADELCLAGGSDEIINGKVTGIV